MLRRPSKRVDAETTAKTVKERPQELELTAEEKELRSRAASILGRLGGSKGGRARAENLSPEKRREIAQKAALSRWKEKG